MLIHLLWAGGITWGLEAVWAGGLTDASISLTAVSLAAAAAGAAAIIVTLGRVGWRKTRLSDRMLHIGAWLVFAWPAIGTLNPDTTWGQRAVTLPLAIAALVVARGQATSTGPSRIRTTRAIGDIGLYDGYCPSCESPRSCAAARPW